MTTCAFCVTNNIPICYNPDMSRTKNVSWRCTDEEYEFLKQRAKEVGLHGPSALLTRIVRFFVQVRSGSEFWHELPQRAKTAGMSSAEYFMELAKQDLPQKDRFGLVGARYIDDEL